MKDISKETVRSLNDLFNLHELHFYVVWADLMSVISEGLSLNIMIIQRNLLQRVLGKGLCTNEITGLAKLITRDCDSRNKVCRGWERKILRERISSKNEDIRRQRIKWLNTTQRVEPLIPFTARTEFRKIKVAELRSDWKAKGDKMLRKVEWLSPEVSDFQDGVPISDKILQEMFGDTAEEGIILGGIEASENI